MVRPYAAGLIAIVSFGTALAQTSIRTQPANSTNGPAAEAATAPAAYVYVSRPTHVDGFAVAANGRLTPVSGSPFANIAVSHMSIAKGFLFGSGDDQTSIRAFAIGANGALKAAAPTNANLPDHDCFQIGPTQVDRTGSTLYLSSLCHDENYAGNIGAFRIESNGGLQFLGNTQMDLDFIETAGSPSPLRFLGANQYAFQTLCSLEEESDSVGIYQRQSSGMLVDSSGRFTDMTAPPNEYYCAVDMAGDATNRVAVAFEHEGADGTYDGKNALATYTADSKGNLTTKFTYKNITPFLTNGESALSASPAGNLIAVGGGNSQGEGGGGFQIFHWNSDGTITHYSGVLQPNDTFLEFGWDKHNHLYALSLNALRVYNVTAAGYSEAAGSPVSIPEASSVIVLSR